METNPRSWIEALCRSHERLGRVAGALSVDQVRGKSYCTDWSIAQVLSHLGSGAEISLIRLTAALGDGVLPEQSVYQQIWDTWDAKSPEAMVADALAADQKHIDAIGRASDGELAGIRLPMFGTELDAVGLIRLRLSEHVLHCWDVEVMIDHTAVLPEDAVSLLIDSVPTFVAPRSGRPRPEPFEARIVTTAPQRDYLLTAADAVRMTDWRSGEVAGDAQTIWMPAEALLRLTSGRLDADHTPADIAADADALSTLREIFPGF